MRNIRPQTPGSRIQDDIAAGITFLDEPVSGVPMARAVVADPSGVNIAPPFTPTFGGIDTRSGVDTRLARLGTGKLPDALPYASFGLRVGAATIDFFILQFASVLIESLFFGALLNNLNSTMMLVATVGPLLATGLLALFYSVWLESSSWQATPGKRIMGLKVVDIEGQRIKFGKASKRNLAKGLSMLSFGIGYLMPLWSPRKQALHDKATGCLVIRASR